MLFQTLLLNVLLQYPFFGVTGWWEVNWPKGIIPPIGDAVLKVRSIRV